MASSVNIAPAWAMDGPTWQGSNLRPIFSGLLQAQAIQVMGGVLLGGGALAVTAGGGMSVNVGSGYVAVPATSVTSGGYLGASMASQNLTVAGADPTNPRIDLVCATINDLGSGSSTWLEQVLTGTPTAGATLSNLNGAPSLPAVSLLLAYVLVPAGSSSVTSGNISDQRVFTTAQGGIVPVPNVATGAATLTGINGMYMHDRSTQRLARLTNANAIAQAIVLPFTPQAARVTGTTGSVSATISVCSVSVTTDGNTDLEILAKWPNLYINASGALGLYGAGLGIFIDGSQVAGISAPATTNTDGEGGGATLHHVTTSGIDRPAAGTHTVALELSPVGDGTHQVQLLNTSGTPTTLYVRAAPL